MKINKLLCIALGAAVLTACSSKRNTLTYFADLDTTVTEVPVTAEQYMTIIQPDDELLITVNSAIPALTAIYNQPLSNPGMASAGIVATTQLQQTTYIVNSKGDINFPVLGTLHVAGLTTEQLQEQLTAAISKDVDDPLVTVRLVNFNINIAGEVKDPGMIKVTRERFSILDALASAGDLTEYGERSNIILVREENGKRITHRLDLTRADILSSPYFFVKQNDYIYVEPNMIRSDNSKYNQNNAFKLSVVSTIVSGCSVVASLIIALAIK